MKETSKAKTTYKEANRDKSQPKQINSSLLRLASVHLLAAIGEDVKQAQDNPMDFLVVMLKILHTHGFTLSQVVSVWNDVIEDKE